MKYKVGDQIICRIEVRPNSGKHIVHREVLLEIKLEERFFQVVAKNETMQTYKIILDDDMVGWQISLFHIEHEKVPVVFNGKKFYDVHEMYVVGKKE